jgi:putative membrane protein
MNATGSETTIAYCGLPPTPEDLVLAWNLDPALIAGLAASGVLVARLATARGPGWTALALAVLVFVSPLCALTSALFSARVLHHVVLIAAIAPLVVLAFRKRLPFQLPAGPVFMVHMAVLWLWHAPVTYHWALATVWGYWLMQATLLASALAVWHVALTRGAAAGIPLLLGTVAQMGLLGALIVFAPIPLYAAHHATTLPWGLDQMADQQLAGLLMWVPAILPYLAVALHLGWRLLPADRAS